MALKQQIQRDDVYSPLLRRARRIRQGDGRVNPVERGKEPGTIRNGFFEQGANRPGRLGKIDFDRRVAVLLPPARK
jgi:hypothetical protein